MEGGLLHILFSHDIWLSIYHVTSWNIENNIRFNEDDLNYAYDINWIR